MPKSKQTTQTRKVARRGEKVRVKETDAALPVKPEPRTRRGPTVPAAIDRRKQVVGTDELKGRSR